MTSYRGIILCNTTPASQASFLLGVVYWILVLGIRSEYNDAGHLHLSASDHHSSDETLRQSQPCNFLTNLFFSVTDVMPQ